MSRLSRREILTASLASAAVASVPAQARTFSEEVPWYPGYANQPHAVAAGPFEFFTPDEAACVDALVSRLIPADDLGPGAKEAGVTVFLDRQLAGSYGRAQTWYMQGPWQEGEKSQGYQSRLTPAQLYREAIAAIDAHCRQQFAGKSLKELTSEQQDAVLSALEKGDVKLEKLAGGSLQIAGAAGGAFFDVLLQNTIEGFFSDPIYGGNRDMAGWKLIGFPGARYNYLPYVSAHNKELKLEPVGLKGRPAWKLGG